MPTLESIPTQAVPTYMLSLTRVIRAPRARVYEAWTNPELLRQWMGPSNKICSDATLDVHVDGAYRIEMHPAPGADHSGDTTECATRASIATGSYTKIVPNELLQFTWSTAWSPGERSLVTLTFKDVEGGTELTLLHENFNTEESRDGHTQGWSGSLDKLVQLLA